MNYRIIPVTAFSQNCSLIWCEQTRLAALVDPGGDEEKIKQVETAETFLFDLGFSDFRVRWMDNKAKIQMPESQLQALMEKREVVLEELSKIFDEVLLDLRTR